MEGYMHYIDQIVARSGVQKLQPLYCISGAAEAAEQRITTLDGFLGMGPVRVGNQAALQTQHDVYGSGILAAGQHLFDQRLSPPGNLAFYQQLEELGEPDPAS